MLKAYLYFRAFLGKEEWNRVSEKWGETDCPEPAAPVLWFHGASVGEALAALILIEKIKEKHTDFIYLLTTGTVTSAHIIQKRTKDHPNIIHQYTPLDHPGWVQRFLTRWAPALAIRMESEIWPNTQALLNENGIPVLLMSARLSEKSFKNWQRFPGMAKRVIQSFDRILTQEKKHTDMFKSLGAQQAHTIGNIKYAAPPLPYDEGACKALKNSFDNRPVWLYASTHEGEEILAAQTHKTLKKRHPDLLTIIVPRHPARREKIKATLLNTYKDLRIEMRSETKEPPSPVSDIYVADTLGETGLFYAACDIAMIGRSFSNDGGGGHNPLEPAQLHCAVLTGPNIQFQTQIFNAMFHDHAALQIFEKEQLAQSLHKLFENKEELESLKEKAYAFVKNKSEVIDDYMRFIRPYLQKIHLN